MEAVTTSHVKHLPVLDDWEGEVVMPPFLHGPLSVNLHTGDRCR